MPSELITAFDEAATRYDDVGVDFFTPMGAELVRRAGIAPGDHVLDVGCGRGAVLRPALAGAAADAAEILDAARTDDGGLALTTTIRIVVARS